MSQRRGKKPKMFNRRLVETLSILLLVGVFVSCAASRQSSIVVPVDPAPEASSFNRVLVAGFATQTDEDLDLGSETVQIVRDQLRARTDRVVLDAEVTSLCDRMDAQVTSVCDRMDDVPNEQDKLLRDDAYWRKLGKEYQEPLIVSGKLRFVKVFRSGFMPRGRYLRDDAGNLQLARVAVFEERNGYALAAEFYFIDGSTGKTVYRVSFTEEVLYRADERVPVLSSYFELMGRLLPDFLTVLNRVTAERDSL